MKLRLLLLTSFLSFMLLPGAYAAPNFSEPVLQKAYEQVNLRIDQKASSLTLDKDSTKSIDQRKEKLAGILVSIDGAFQRHDKKKLAEQAKLFREAYREAMSFVQNLANTGVSPNSIHKDAPKVPGDAKITEKTTDITYYADSFEWGRTANGNPFSQSFFSAAACGIPFNTLIQVGKGNTSVIVKTNDRPNCVKYPNLTDLTTTAFRTIGKISSGKISGTTNTLGTVPKSYMKRVLQTNVFKDLWITLDSGIPNTYLKNETIHISGKELAGKEYTILYLKSPSGKDITLGMKKWQDGSFEYSYPLEETGVYQMVVASGSGFDTSTFVDITVLEDSVFAAKKLISSATSPEKIDKLEVERQELPNLVSLYVFHLSPKYFHTVTIKGEKETFVYRGFGTISIRSDALQSLDTSKSVLVEIDSQESSTPFSHDTTTAPITIFSKDMILAPGYKTERNENITVHEEGGNLLINGIISKGKKVKGEAVLTLPNGDVEKYTFNPASIDTDGYLKRERVFEKTVPLKQTGLYLVEINYDDGFAAYNGPVAYGDVLPAYPSDYDTVRKEIGNSDISLVSVESLNFVNKVRARSGKSTISLDDTLNNLATIKANDMAMHHTVSHTDSNGDKISGTAKHNGIKIAGAVGENVAGGNVGFRMLLVGLANSGGHRGNMLDAWKKVGIGYAVNDGQVYYVQVFWE